MVIPELTELPGRGYQSGVYEWFEYLEDLPEEYEFLRNYTVVIIIKIERTRSCMR